MDFVVYFLLPGTIDLKMEIVMRAQNEGDYLATQKGFYAFGSEPMNP